MPLEPRRKGIPEKSSEILAITLLDHLLSQFFFGEEISLIRRKKYFSEIIDHLGRLRKVPHFADLLTLDFLDYLEIYSPSDRSLEGLVLSEGGIPVNQTSLTLVTEAIRELYSILAPPQHLAQIYRKRLWERERLERLARDPDEHSEFMKNIYLYPQNIFGTKESILIGLEAAIENDFLMFIKPAR